MSIGTISTDDLQSSEPLPVYIDFGSEGTRLFLYKGLFGESPYESPDQYAVDWCFLSKKITQYQLDYAKNQLIFKLQKRYGRWYYPIDIDILQVKGVYSVLIHNSEFLSNSSFRLHHNYKEYRYIYEVQYAIKTVAESIRAMDKMKNTVANVTQRTKPIERSEHPEKPKFYKKWYKIVDFDDNELDKSTDIAKLKSIFLKKYPYFKPKDVDPFIYEIND
jgi:hypothetical protein